VLRNNGDPERRVFDPTTRLLHWLTVGLVLMVFVLAFSTNSATSVRIPPSVKAASLVRLISLDGE
jgi:cytochrome b